MLDFRRLRYFLAITECGSLSAAARALRIAQPALSYHLAEMERTLGLKLFTRRRHGVDLTEDGDLLREYAADIIHRADQMEAAMAARANRQPVPAPVRLAIITSLAAALTPRLAQRFRASAGVSAPSLSIVEAGTREIRARLSRGEIDMGLCLAAGPGYAADPVAQEELLLVAPAATGADDPKDAALPYSALAEHRLVLPARGNPFRDDLEARAQAGGIALDVVLEVDGFASRLNAVATGIGATLIGAHPIPSAVREYGLRICRFAPPGLPRMLFLGRRQGLDTAIATQVADVVAGALRDIGLAPAAPSGGDGGAVL